MLLPIKCPVCCNEISSKAKIIIDYKVAQLEKNPNGDLTEIYDKLGMNNYCCRSQININNIRESITPRKY
jgi:DNA-directed RNA polymerase subunit N (RpoN/RPB10)